MQLQKTRLESEEYTLRLEMVEKEAQSDREEMEREVEQSRKQLHARVKEMEMLREALRRLENELREARENMHIQDRRNTEHNSTLSELRVKVIMRVYSCLQWNQKGFAFHDVFSCLYVDGAAEL